MKIDDLKKEIKKVRAPEMDFTISPDRVGSAGEFFDLLRKQDRKDEKYMLKQKIVPILVGLVLWTTVMIIAPLRTPVMFTGSFLLFAGLVVALIMFVNDYKNISSERKKLRTK